MSIAPSLALQFWRHKCVTFRLISSCWRLIKPKLWFFLQSFFIPWSSLMKLKDLTPSMNAWQNCWVESCKLDNWQLRNFKSSIKFSTNLVTTSDYISQIFICMYCIFVIFISLNDFRQGWLILMKTIDEKLCMGWGKKWIGLLIKSSKIILCNSVCKIASCWDCIVPVIA